MAMHWMLRELARSATREPRKAAFNPKPPGSMQTGSATYKALATLCEARGNWLSYGDILAGMGASKGRSIDWSLRLVFETRRRLNARAKPRSLGQTLVK